ncbi:MAG TPA: amino acid adenylation domain-containing protein, partial [Thermoanaerobaculia bacterium]|nr:amino acid adenylation domain-containing protein [Thermoanaerobaculia bacterium]
LEALGREGGATLFMVLLAAAQTLFLRLSGQADVSVGSPIANRQRAEVEPLIGFFVNTLVLRTDLSGDPGFRELLGRVRRVALEAYAHQDVPFSQVVEAVHPERSLAHSPLFQVLFALQNAPAGRLEIAELALEPFEAPVRTSMFDLTLSAAEIPEGLASSLAFSIEYRTDLFDGTTAARWLSHLEMLLRGVVAAPDLALADLPLLREAERFQVLTEWSRPEALFPGDEILPVLLSRQVEAAPDAPALTEIEGAGPRMTYGGLWSRVLRLARRLRALGVGPEVCVGISLERSADQVIAALAVIQAGGAYVPLDLAHPLERIALMLETASVPVVIALEPQLPGLPQIPGLRVLCLDRDRAEIERERAEPFDSGATADTLAYVMYTSGSTGTPKGVAIPHRGIARLARWCREIGIGPGDSFLLFAPFAFDLSTLEIWGAFLNGARLVVPPAGPASLEEIGDWVDRQGVTVLWLTAGLFHQMADSRPGGALDRLASLRFLMAGGDALSVPHVRQVLERLPGVGMVNGYGPTENTTFTCCHRFEKAPAEARVPIGRPIGNTTVLLLDRAGRPVPVGVPGELHAGGDGLARGYLGRPDLTAERFVPSPLAGTEDAAGARLYRTGDLARWRPDGTLDFLGRIDQQVKIRGFRIEPGEIEAALEAHPGVTACAVVVRSIGGPAAESSALVAYVVRDETQPSMGELREHLRRRLPEFMVPAFFVALSELPLTPNGKVDRRALPNPEREPAAADLSAPRTPLEELLAGIWAEVLGQERVGIHDSFFDLGGHSLLATRVISRLRGVLGIELPVRTLFEQPTVAALAAVVEATSRTPAPPLVPHRHGTEIPLSPAQERLWFLDRLEPGNPAYNVPLALRLRGPLSAPALAAALAAVARRHEVLRTRFVEAAGRPVQELASAAG